MRRLTFLGAFLSALTGKLFAQQPVIITPGPTTFGPPKPVNGECPACHTKNKVPLRSVIGADAYIERCTFCSCMFAIDTVE